MSGPASSDYFVAAETSSIQRWTNVPDAAFLALRTFGLGALTACVLIAFCCTSIYAAFYARGLYGDGAVYLLKIGEIERFNLHDPQRMTVEILRQLIVVMLRRLTNLDLFQLGQAFSLSMLLLPALLCALCWPILPRHHKPWIIFPMLGLLAGVNASSFLAIGEGAIAAGYMWLLLFLFLFRTSRTSFQVFFVMLCIPAFFLHESVFIFTLVLLFACVEKLSATNTRRDRVFVILCMILFVSIVVYEIRWIIWPLSLVDRTAYIAALRRLAFLVDDGHWNLPLITGALGLTTIAIGAALQLWALEPIATIVRRVVTLIFVSFSIIAAIAAWPIDVVFSPLSQTHARNQAMFVGSVLGAIAVLALNPRIPRRIWLQPATIAVIFALSSAQFSWDLAATQRWREYIGDVRGRLARSEGLVSWEQNLASGDPAKNDLWRVMDFGWPMPSLSVIIQSGNPVRSMIAAPIGTPWQPFDPSNLDKLPKIRGVDYAPYIRAVWGGRTGAAPRIDDQQRGH